MAETKCIEDCTSEGTRLAVDRKHCVSACVSDSLKKFFYPNLIVFFFFLQKAEYEEKGLCYACTITDCSSCDFIVEEYCKVFFLKKKKKNFKK